MRAGLRAQLAAMPGAPTLKEALLAALVEGRTSTTMSLAILTPGGRHRRGR